MTRTRDDGMFRFTTAAFAAVVLLIVIAIGVELWRQSFLSIEKFGLHFWTGRYGIPCPASSARSRSCGGPSIPRFWRC